MDTHEAAWMAGLFDGEGCITRDKRGGWRLAVSMTDEDVVRRLARTAGVGRVHGPRINAKQPTNKPYWVWFVGHQLEVYALLQAMLPWFGERRKARAQAACEEIDGRPPIPARGRPGLLCRAGLHLLADTEQVRPDGTRYCKECANDRRKERYVRRERVPLRGELSPSSKLTDAQRIEIRTRFQKGEQQRVLAAEYNVSQSQVSRLCSQG